MTHSRAAVGEEGVAGVLSGLSGDGPGALGLTLVLPSELQGVVRLAYTLNHLIRRSGRKEYISTRDGVKALRTLHWPTVVNTQPSPYLRALFDDLADWLGVPNPLGPTDPTLPRPPTALCADPGRLLRNIPAASPSP